MATLQQNWHNRVKRPAGEGPTGSDQVLFPGEFYGSKYGLEESLKNAEVGMKKGWLPRLYFLMEMLKPALDTGVQ